MPPGIWMRILISFIVSDVLMRTFIIKCILQGKLRIINDKYLAYFYSMDLESLLFFGHPYRPNIYVLRKMRYAIDGG
ncbi:hypothetical protein AB834_01270 [PVC group bacterium (ex Bugula neritina AB1)]|nr:hypothetical protein AB834_01270 [PVC group bacterium (ex Bugula neritina AB1)]